MKKTFLFLAAALMSTMTFAGWTDLSESLDLTTMKVGQSAYNASTVYNNWTIVNGANNSGKWAYFKMGGKEATLKTSNPCYIYYSAASGVESKVDSITVSIASGSLSKDNMSVNSWGVYVYSDKAMKTQIDYVAGGTITKNAATFGFKPSAGKTWAAGSYYKVSWDLANTTSTNGIVCVDKVTLHAFVQTTDPTISAKDLDFGTYIVGMSEAKSLAVSGENLTSAITYAWEKGGLFSATGELSVEGGTLTIDVVANTDVEAVDSLILTSDATVKKVAVKALVVKTIGDGTKENPYTVADVKKLGNPGFKDVWVTGTIIGAYVGNKPAPGVPEETKSNMALATGTDTIPVALPSGDIQKELNLVDHPDYLGRTVKVKGELVAYFSTTGVKSTSAYELGAITSIVTTKREAAPVKKMLINGQVVLVKDGKYYNLLGSPKMD